MPRLENPENVFVRADIQNALRAGQILLRQDLVVLSSGYSSRSARDMSTVLFKELMNGKFEEKTSMVVKSRRFHVSNDQHGYKIAFWSGEYSEPTLEMVKQGFISVPKEAVTSS